MSAVASQPTSRPRPRQRFARALRRPGPAFGAIVVLLFVGVALLAPLIAPYNPLSTDWSAIRQAPSWHHLLGTDELGRDELSRILWGARVSLLAGVVSVAIALILGVPLGLLAGYFPGWPDELVMRLTDALLALPFLVLALALAAALGPSLLNAMIAIGISSVPGFIRLVRGQVLAAKVEEYVQAARACGASDLRILFRHILPNIYSPLLIQATLQIGASIIAESFLSFLGLGQQPPTPAWGSMLNTAMQFLQQAPWLSIFPGAAIFFTVLAFNLLGDGLREALDPRS
jgi:peptide/nickel transport system permease protein